MQVLGQLIAAQLPASGNWSRTARRLNHVWDAMRRTVGGHTEHGAHSLKLLTDQDHYACVTMARDTAQNQIMIGCDLYGAAAETSVLVPMERAAEMGRRVRLLYQRPSKFLSEQGHTPDPASAGSRGLLLEKIDGLHGKFLIWDSEALAITSFTVIGCPLPSRGPVLGRLSWVY